VARAVPRPLDGLAEIGANVAHEWREALSGARGGDDLDAWDPEYIRRTLPILGRLFRNYFRGEVHGLDHIPEGPALLVGNHSGGTMIADTFVFATCFYERFGPERRFHQLAHDLAARLPGLGIRPWGTVRASHENAKKAFALGAPVLVYPGGDWETFRPSWQTDRIDFADRKGFIHLACEENVPVSTAPRGSRSCPSRSARPSASACSTCHPGCRFRRRSRSRSWIRSSCATDSARTRTPTRSMTR
jgi:hypothetical protein